MTILCNFHVFTDDSPSEHEHDHDHDHDHEHKRFCKQFCKQAVRRYTYTNANAYAKTYLVETYLVETADCKHNSKQTADLEIKY